MMYNTWETGDTMKTYKTKQKLYELLSRVKFHEDVIDEIDRLVVQKGITNQFVRMLEKNIDKIETLGTDVTRTNNFEKLKDAKGLYSMKFKGKNMNLRMLYSYDTETNTIMLHMFYEREDSRKERYEEHIPIALKRMESWRDK